MPIKYKAPNGAFHKQVYTVSNSVTNTQNDVSIIALTGKKSLSDGKTTLLPSVSASIISELPFPGTASADRIFIKY